MIIIKKLISFLIFLFSFESIYPQNVYIIDSGTNNPVPYSRIINLNQNYWFFTDENGYFTMPENFRDTDSLLITSMGYSDLRIKIAELTEKLALKPEPILLSEAVVSPEKPKTKTLQLGFAKDHVVPIAAFISGKPAQTMLAAVYIPNEKKQNCFLKNLIYRCDNKSGHVSYIVRPQIYTVGADNAPDIPLLKSNAYYSLPEEKPLYKFNCENEHIIFPENGLFVSIELLDVLDNEGKSVIDKYNKELGDMSSEIKFPFMMSINKKNKSYSYIVLASNIEWRIVLEGSGINWPFGVELSCKK